MRLAQALLKAPLMSNHSRGLWGYHGHTEDGQELSIQATGIGGPSVAVVLTELVELGVRQAVRTGTCRSLDASVPRGAVLAVLTAHGEDGISRQLGTTGPTSGDPELTSSLLSSGATAAVIATRDLYYELGADLGERAGPAGAGYVAVDLATAGLFAVADQLGVAVACGLIVTEDAHGERLVQSELEGLELELGRMAVDALAAATLTTDP